MRYRPLMIQGVRAGIGKSLIVIGLSRILTQAGLRVGVFKAQAMEDRAVRLSDGGILPANLVLAAQGCGMPLTKMMCPILLTPSQPIGDAIDNLSLNLTYDVFLLGERVGRMSLATYYKQRNVFWLTVQNALQQIIAQYDLVILEGSGNPVELNTTHWDFSNMRVAEVSNAAVLLVADLSLGGAFAALAGVLDLLPPIDRSRIVGLLMNKAVSEEDVSFVSPGAAKLEQRVGVPVLGIVPIIHEKVFNYPKTTFMEPDAVPWEPVYDHWARHLIDHLDRVRLADIIPIPITDEENG